MAEKEIDVLGDAIANTERGLFEEATGKTASSRRGDGPVDRSLEDVGDGLEGQVEDDQAEEGETEEAEADGDTEADSDDKGEDRDDKGRFKAKSEDKEEEPDAKAEADTEEEPAPKPKGAIPPGRLREQTERAAAAEARAKAAEDALKAAREETEKRFSELNAKFEGFTLANRQQQQPKPEPAKVETPPKPDMFADPEGYDKWVQDRVTERIAATEQKFESILVERSMASAHGLHKEAFEKAYQAVTALDRSDPSARATVQRIWKSPDPGAALMNWHREQETLREVGTDPAKYRENIAKETREALMKDPEFRKQLLADLRADANGSNGGQARTTTRLPKALSDVAGGKSAHRDDATPLEDSDEAHFNSAFATN